MATQEKQGDIVVALIEKKKMTENQLKWFGHIHRSLEAAMSRVDSMVFSHMEIGSERPGRTLGEVVKRNLMVNNLVLNLCSQLHLVE